MDQSTRKVCESLSYLFQLGSHELREVTVEQMIAQPDALLTARYAGIRTVDIDGRRVSYARDAELQPPSRVWNAAWLPAARMDDGVAS